MVGIQVTILVALFEYAFILALTRNVREMKQEITPVKSVQDREATQYESHIDKKEHKFKLMDRYTEIGSAMFFIIFNICYWLIATMN